ncbi:MAG: hypothetical protein U0W65_14365 [Bacteroidia bacterium]
METNETNKLFFERFKIKFAKEIIRLFKTFLISLIVPLFLATLIFFKSHYFINKGNIEYYKKMERECDCQETTRHSERNFYTYTLENKEEIRKRLVDEFNQKEAEVMHSHIAEGTFSEFKSDKYSDEDLECDIKADIQNKIRAIELDNEEIIDECVGDTVMLKWLAAFILLVVARYLFYFIKWVVNTSKRQL